VHGTYDVAGGPSSGPGDWTSGHPPTGQLEGPGMPVARASSHPALAIAKSAAMASSNLSSGDVQVAVAAGDAGAVEGEIDGDDQIYCFCGGISYGEMIACDDNRCEKEWVCVSIVLRISRQIDISSLTVPSGMYWAYCTSPWGMVL
jgi:inhibitor of growth protein 3